MKNLSQKVEIWVRKDFPVIASWVKHVWEQIPESMVKRSFKHCGISNALNGTGDDAILE